MRAPRAVDLELALLAERRARGRDGQRMRSAATSTVDLWPCWHCVCTWWRRQVRGQASSSQASRSQGTAPDEPPALIADSSDEEEPVSGVRIDASPGKPDLFDASPGKPDCSSSCSEAAAATTAVLYAVESLSPSAKVSNSQQSQSIHMNSGKRVNWGSPRSL